MKIVLNKDPYSSFNVSQEFCEHYGIPYKTYMGRYSEPTEEIARTDHRLIEFIETYGSDRSSDIGRSLEIDEIPSGAAYVVIGDGCAEYVLLRDKFDWQIAE